MPRAARIACEDESRLHGGCGQGEFCVHEYRVHWRRAVWAVCVAVPIVIIGVVGAGAWAAVSAPRPVAPAEQPAAAAPVAAPAAEPAAPEPPAPEQPAPEPAAPPAAAPPVDPLRPGCPGTTVMSVWAHYDDDLLFLGTPISDALAAGQCVRTVFLTGGDAGKGADYEAGRERGIQRAYDVMRAANGTWSSTTATLATGAQVEVWAPDGDLRVSLVFFRLPDGDLDGSGYPATGEVSLAKLAADKIVDLPDLAGRYRIGWHGLVDSVAELAVGFQPGTFYSHVPGGAYRYAKGDHADHAITGVIARAAWAEAAVPGATAYYAMGYQTAQHPSNVSGPALTRKVDAFRAYAGDDPVTAACRDMTSCLAVPRFGPWLERQYLFTEAQIAAG